MHFNFSQGRYLNMSVVNFLKLINMLSSLAQGKSPISAYVLFPVLTHSGHELFTTSAWFGVFPDKDSAYDAYHSVHWNSQ